MSKTNGGNGVDLDFYPIVSAMDITLTATKTVRLNSVNIRAEDGEAIAGKYVADLSTITEQKPAPDCDLTNSPELNLNFITIPLYTDPGTGIPVPMEIEAGHSIKLTVFLLPHVNLDNLSVSVSHVNAAAKKKDLVGITLEPHKKVIVTMQLPEWSSSDNVNTWFSNLNPNVYISQLSIPGTVNAFSYLLKDGDLNKSQTADIEKQWNAGVRCFELRSPNNVKGGSLAGAPLQCNRNDLGITFGDAFTQIINLLEKNPTEFVMIMPSFETSAGHSGTDNERKVSNSEDYLRDLNEFYNSFNMPSTLHFVTYNEEMVVGDLRGGVMSIARITSEEDDQSLVDNLRDIGIAQGQAITGWGSLKDNWGNRGYLRNGTRVSNYAKDYNDGKNMEYCMLNGNTTHATSTIWGGPSIPEHLTKTDVPVGYSNDIVLPDKTDLENFKSVVDYSHDSFRSDKSIGKVFVHEWLRVVPSKAAGNYYLYYTNDNWEATEHTMHWAYWKESYSEKQNDVWNTFLMSQEANKGQLGYAFFINSLEGYYVDPNINLSYWPYIDQNKPHSGDFGQGGVEGDITTYAQDINTWFYEKLLDVGMNNITGPLNIVLLNRVLDGSAGGDYLPQVIVDNNFKFPLMMK